MARKRKQRLPRGLVQRRGQYVYRDQRHGRIVWVKLGEEYEPALARYAEIRQNGSTFSGNVSVAAELWLARYVATRRHLGTPRWRAYGCSTTSSLSWARSRLPS